MYLCRKFRFLKYVIMEKDQFLELLHEQQSSGLSIKAYCEAHSIALSTFYFWKHRFLSSPSSEEGNHLSLRTGKMATIITTNLSFTRWEEVLKDKVLCAALVDRLCHKSYLVNMTGQSYRIKETKKVLKNTKNMTINFEV